VCEYEGFPGYKWQSASDDTDVFPGVVCRRVDPPLPGGSLSSFRNWFQIVKLLLELP
jgi:hypothetical protein